MPMACPCAKVAPPPGGGKLCVCVCYAYTSIFISYRLYVLGYRVWIIGIGFEGIGYILWGYRV